MGNLNTKEYNESSQSTDKHSLGEKMNEVRDWYHKKILHQEQISADGKDNQIAMKCSPKYLLLCLLLSSEKTELFRISMNKVYNIGNMP